MLASLSVFVCRFGKNVRYRTASNVSVWPHSCVSIDLHNRSALKERTIERERWLAICVCLCGCVFVCEKTMLRV